MSSPRKTRRSGKEKIERTLAKLTTLIEKHCGSQVEIATEAAERALVAVGATPRPLAMAAPAVPSVLNKVRQAEASMAALRAFESGAPAAAAAPASASSINAQLLRAYEAMAARKAAAGEAAEEQIIVAKSKRAPTCPGGPKLFNAFIKAIVDPLKIARPGLPYEEYRTYALPYWKHVKTALCGMTNTNAATAVKQYAARALELVLQNWPRKNHGRNANVLERLSPQEQSIQFQLPSAASAAGLGTLPAFVQAAEAASGGVEEENSPVAVVTAKPKKSKTRKANRNAAAAAAAAAAVLEQQAANRAAENAARRLANQAAFEAAQAAAAEAEVGESAASGGEKLPASRLTRNSPLAAAAPMPPAATMAAAAAAGRLPFVNEGANNMGTRKVRIGGEPYFYNNSTGALFRRNNANNSYGAEVGTWNNNAGQIKYLEE